MTNKDLYPCPWCRSEQVFVVESERVRDDIWFVYCEACCMCGPEQDTADKARQVYNVVANLVDNTINYWFSVQQPHTSTVPTYAMEFMAARREHAPY